MQSISFTHVTLIEESRESSGRPLWLSLTNRASKLGFNTRVMLFAELEKDLAPLLPNHQCISYVDCLRSAKTFPELSHLLQSTADEIGLQKSVMVIDNLTLLARRHGVDRMASLLYSVGQICPILTRFQRDCFSVIEQNRLKSITNTILVLSKDKNIQICTTITYKKEGLGLREKVESYEISPETLAITSRSVDTATVKKPVSSTTTDFMPCHTTPKAVSSRERAQREKASVVLPYTRAQTEKGLVGLNANRKTMGAKIEYFAEKSDDLEDSDPDDELMY